MNGADLVIVFDRGTATAVYDDELIDVLQALGAVHVARASHVEPAPAGGWIADMGPSGGPVLGPFPRRDGALAAERAWLALHRGI